MKQQMETIVGNLLRYGVVVSALIIGTGLALRFLHPRLPSQQPTTIQHFSEFFDLPAYSDPDRIILAGVFLLILLPVTRVGLTILLFLIEGDYLYVAMTAFVFGVLLFGLSFGKTL